MRIGIIGDTHLGCTDYSPKRRADFSAAFCNAVEICRDKGSDAICLLGDVFDSAATRRNVDAFAEILKEISPSLVQLKTAQIPLIAIPGNHEFGRGREAGELTVLECLGFVRVLRGTEFKHGSVRICGIPWQHDPAEVPRLVELFRGSSHSGPQILLLHNFIRVRGRFRQSCGRLIRDVVRHLTEYSWGTTTSMRRSRIALYRDQLKSKTCSISLRNTSSCMTVKLTTSKDMCCPGLIRL